MRNYKTDRTLIMAREKMIRALHRAMITRERLTIAADTFAHHSDAAELRNAGEQVAVALHEAWTAITAVGITPLGRNT